MKKISVASCKAEKDYIDIAMNFDESLRYNEESPQEGFEYFESPEYMDIYSDCKSMIVHKFKKLGFKKGLKVMKIYSKFMPRISKCRDSAFKGAQGYLDEISANDKLANSDDELLEFYPNEDIWEELCDYAWINWGIRLGFTEIDPEHVFKEKAVIFKYAIICIQEMEKSEIDQAPEIPAGREAIRVYDSLGEGVNDIANFLRIGHNIRCHSNHPIGGLLNLVPLAQKAGLGLTGMNGLLITSDYGQRQRIAPILVQDKLFLLSSEKTKESKHVECTKCKKCYDACPVNAIKEDSDGNTCIDRIQCYEQFNQTMGCSICIKVCPYSQKEKVVYLDTEGSKE